MRILRAADHRVMPWKNGLGATTEIAVAPAQDGGADFDWRVSMAQVVTDGLFSRFPGIDRTLLVLEGHGIVLDVAGQPAVRLDRDSVHAFPGDQPTSATLIDGPILDLNVMTRRSHVQHRVARRDIGAAQDFAVTTQALLVVEHGALAVGAGETAASLGRFDALLVDSGDARLTLQATSDTSVIVVELVRRSLGLHRF